MQIYIAALAAYNAGTLHGAWVTLETSDDKATIDKAIVDILRTSPTPNVWRQDYEDDGETMTVTHSYSMGYDADNMPIFPDAIEAFCKFGDMYRSEEEWAIHDYDEFPNMGEYVSSQEIADVLELMAEHGEDVVCAVLEAESDLSYAKSMLNEFVGKFNSFRDYADELADEMIGARGSVDDMLTRYFDYEAFARDLKYDYTVQEYEGSTYIFGNF